MTGLIALGAIVLGSFVVFAGTSSLLRGVLEKTVFSNGAGGTILDNITIIEVTETLSEFGKLRLGQFLIAQHDNAELQKGPVDLLELVAGEVCDIQPADLAAHGPG